MAYRLIKYGEQCPAIDGVEASYLCTCCKYCFSYPGGVIKDKTIRCTFEV